MFPSISTEITLSGSDCIQSSRVGATVLVSVGIGVADGTTVGKLVGVAVGEGEQAASKIKISKESVRNRGILFRPFRF